MSIAVEVDDGGGSFDPSSSMLAKEVERSDGEEAPENASNPTSPGFKILAQQALLAARTQPRASHVNEVCLGWPRLLALLLILANSGLVAWGQIAYSCFYIKYSKEVGSASNPHWETGKLYRDNMWLASQNMLGDQLYFLSWFIVVLPGIFPYLQMFALGFVCVTSLGLMRRDWMLKYLAGAGRWALLIVYLVIVLLGMVNVNTGNIGGRPHSAVMSVSIVSDFGILNLGGALVLAQVVCCIFEVAHATTEEVALAHAAQLMHGIAKVDAQVGGRDYGTFNENNEIWLGGDDAHMRPRYYREAGGHAFCVAVEWQRSCILTPLLFVSIAFMGWGITLPLCSMETTYQGIIISNTEHSLVGMLWQVHELAAKANGDISINECLAVFGALTLVVIPVGRGVVFMLMWLCPLRHSTLSIMYDVQVVLSCFNCLDVFLAAVAVVYSDVAKIGKLIDKDLSLEMTLGVGMWILLAGVVLFYLTQPRGLLIPRKYVEHLRTLLWEEMAGMDLNPPQYNWIRNLVRPDRDWDPSQARPDRPDQAH